MQGNKDNCYYVYQVKLDGEVVYIGKGKGDRWKHPTSGISHIKVFNEVFFKGNLHRIVVDKVITGLVAPEAMQIEFQQILEKKPLLNRESRTILRKMDFSARTINKYLLEEYPKGQVKLFGKIEKFARANVIYENKMNQKEQDKQAKVELAKAFAQEKSSARYAKLHSQGAIGPCWITDSIFSKSVKCSNWCICKWNDKKAKLARKKYPESRPK